MFVVMEGKNHKETPLSFAEAGRIGGRSRSRQKIASALTNLELAHHGAAHSPAVAAAARLNGRLGGRPRTKKKTRRTRTTANA